MELEKFSATQSRADRLSDEIAQWKLLAKGLGNDGVIALTIDDAGPALTHTVNELLLACYGMRFTVEIRTQRTLASGELREGFEILVHDAESDSSKSVPSCLAVKGLDQRVPDAGHCALSRAEHRSAVSDPVQRRVRRAARYAAQSAVHAHEARGTAPGRVSARVLHLADARTCRGSRRSYRRTGARRLILVNPCGESPPQGALLVLHSFLAPLRRYSHMANLLMLLLAAAGSPSCAHCNGSQDYVAQSRPSQVAPAETKPPRTPRLVGRTSAFDRDRQRPL